MTDTLNRLGELFREIFDDDELTISRTTTAADIDEWDSLMHVNIILTVERDFGIRFSSSEVATLLNVGQLADFIKIKLDNDHAAL